MRMSGEQLSNAVAAFIQQDMLPNVEPGALKLVLATVGAALKRNNQLMESILNGAQGAQMLLQYDGNTYDPDLLISAVRDGVTGAGGLSITIPKIPLLMPAECKITLNRGDIEKLAAHLQ